MIIHTRDLDAFVKHCDELGGIGSPEARQYIHGFLLEYDTPVDQSLDPFSDTYFAAQCRLYEEISGRSLDQETGEKTPLDVERHVCGANPYNSRDTEFIAKHAMAILSLLRIANLPHGARVLDLGCGWGLSTEMMAFCGCDMTPVDINPDFVKLVSRRLADRHIPAIVHQANFDTVELEAEHYDLAVFYECLHHAIRPWETLASLGSAVRPGGKIAFAGEPINAYWWAHWGLRLDAESVYCIRKFGWFESGWTAEFLAACFSRAGWRLTYHNYLGLDGGTIGIASREADLAQGQAIPDTPERVNLPFLLQHNLNAQRPFVQRNWVRLRNLAALSKSYLRRFRR